MNIRYRQIKGFLLAARLGSFKKAAALLSITQPSFSILIKELEENLGVELFDRTTRKCTLTYAGQIFQKEVAGVMEGLEDVYQYMQEFGQGRRGQLNIAALSSLSFGIIPKTLSDFQRLYPEVAITLREMRNNQVFDAVCQREVELGMGSLLKADPALTFVPLFTDQLMLIVPIGHPLEHSSVRWKTLERYPYIMMSTGPAEYAVRANNVDLHVAFEVDHVATALAMVRHNMGITALPSSVLPSLNMDGLAHTPILGPLATRNLGIAYRKGACLSASATIFIEMLKETAPLDLAVWKPYSSGL